MHWNGSVLCKGIFAFVTLTVFLPVICQLCMCYNCISTWKYISQFFLHEIYMKIFHMLEVFLSERWHNCQCNDNGKCEVKFGWLMYWYSVPYIGVTYYACMRTHVPILIESPLSSEFDSMNSRTCRPLVWWLGPLSLVVPWQSSVIRKSNLKIKSPQ